MRTFLAKNANLGRLADIAIIMLCLAVGYKYLVSRPTEPPSEVASNERYVRGGQVDPVDGIDFHTADRSLLIFVRSTCSFCTASMPFYSRLVEAAVGSTGRLQVAMLSTEPVATTRRYIAAHQIDPDRVLVGQGANFKIAGTPTIVLVDAKGKVLRVWRGKVPEDVEANIIDVALTEGD